MEEESNYLLGSSWVLTSCSTTPPFVGELKASNQWSVISFMRSICFFLTVTRATTLSATPCSSAPHSIKGSSVRAITGALTLFLKCIIPLPFFPKENHMGDKGSLLRWFRKWHWRKDFELGFKECKFSTENPIIFAPPATISAAIASSWYEEEEGERRGYICY